MFFQNFLNKKAGAPYTSYDLPTKGLENSWIFMNFKDKKKILEWVCPRSSFWKDGVLPFLKGPQPLSEKKIGWKGSWTLWTFGPKSAVSQLPARLRRNPVDDYYLDPITNTL